jgi:hypothetical protein
MALLFLVLIILPFTHSCVMVTRTYGVASPDGTTQELASSPVVTAPGFLSQHVNTNLICFRGGSGLTSMPSPHVVLAIRSK